jgi:UDP-N-acetylglucosamine 2-epimerase (non-hydrolysing)
MKLAPVARAVAEKGRFELRFVHTGQHYDANMSEVFFVDLGIPLPDVHLEVGSGPQGGQTARILERYEALLLQRPPSATVVFGDVNSTIACALAATKLGVPVVHVEGGNGEGPSGEPSRPLAGQDPWLGQTTEGRLVRSRLSASDLANRFSLSVRPG